jgi:hypothetical protein
MLLINELLALCPQRFESQTDRDAIPYQRLQLCFCKHAIGTADME